MARYSTPLHLQLLLLLAAFLITVQALEPTVSCATTGECCDRCGADSYRCARGPCSDNVLTEDFFSFSLPTDAVGFWDIVFSFYSTVPYDVLIVLVIEFVVHKRSWTRVFVFVLAVIITVFNTVILVRLLGDCSECPRPCGSCVVSNGMPSGHATNAIGLAMWTILETIIGLGKSWSRTKKTGIVVAAVLLLAPVPYSRVYLGDHTALQVTIGSANGLILGFLYFCLLRFLVGRRLDGVTRFIQRRCCGLVIHNDYTEEKATPPSIEVTLLESEEEHK